MASVSLGFNLKAHEKFYGGTVQRHLDIGLKLLFHFDRLIDYYLKYRHSKAQARFFWPCRKKGLNDGIPFSEVTVCPLKELVFLNFSSSLEMGVVLAFLHYFAEIH